MPQKIIKCSVTNYQPFRLVPTREAPHKFGGECKFSGITPGGTKVPIQQVLLIDLRDPNVPFKTDPQIRYLPLLYPFKYGIGGPKIQYAIVSDTKIRILYMSSPEPDEPEFQYLQVPVLPEQPLALKALCYEEARCLAFMRGDCFFRLNRRDRAILNRLDDGSSLIEVGGRRDHITNAGEIICRNPKCQQLGKRTWFRFIAMVPPIPVNGTDDFWHEFRGDVQFVFVLCDYCGTIISFNVAG